MPPKAAGLYPALLAVQAEAPTLQKTAINPHFKSKFVPLDVVTEAVMPILNKNGLVWMTLPGVTENGNPVLRYSLVHAETQESVEGAMALLPQKSDPQGQGSAITYARRYALMAVLGLVADEDDDGNAASKRKPEVHNNVDVTGGPEFLADQVAALPGTVELANADQLERLDKARVAVGAKRFDAHLVSQGVNNPGELTKETAETVLAWARGQKKAKAAA